MSDSEGDISDELLELAGATERKRKKRQALKSSASKRRKADVEAEDSGEDQPESEEDGEANLYPLEGKYKDEEDRQRLLELPEIEREDILASRQEEMQRIQDKRNLDQMLKAQSRGEENVSKAAKRQHAVRGATKEKSRKLDELKAKRKAKDEKKRTRTNSPKRELSSSPVDMEMSDEEEEDGQITRYEEQEERERKMYDKYEKTKQEKDPDEPPTLEILEKCRISRDQLSRLYMAPLFEESIKGAYVRLLIGNENGNPVYRICEVVEISPDPVRPYKLNEQTVNRNIRLKHGQSERSFMMDKVSNSQFDQKEFDRLVRTHEIEKVKMPTRRQLEQKAAQVDKFLNTPMTESDITAMLARKSLLQSASNKLPSSTSMTMERSRLVQARTLASRRQDWAEVKAIEEKLAQLMASTPTRESSVSREDILAKVNERNRKANLEQVRKAEMQEAERKRRERKMHLLAAGGGGTPRPSTPADPSARLKATPNLLSPSRPGTPATPSLDANGATPRSISPLPPSLLSTPVQVADTAGSFEASVIQSVEIDLGDF